jgi:hypothetical protein
MDKQQQVTPKKRGSLLALHEEQAAVVEGNLGWRNGLTALAETDKKAYLLLIVGDGPRGKSIYEVRYQADFEAFVWLFIIMQVVKAKRVSYMVSSIIQVV